MKDYSATIEQLASTIGSNLKARRKAVFPKDTQEQMAARLGIGVSTYGRMERGDPSVSLKLYLYAADILRCSKSFESLFTLGDDPRAGSLIEQLIREGA